MATRGSSQSIDEAAADWVARRDRGPLSPADEAAFHVWLAGDVRRPGAMLRAQAVFKRSEAAVALSESYDPANFRSEPEAAPALPLTPPPFTPAPFTRRRVLAWGGGAVAACLAGAIGMTLYIPDAYATERGEMRLVRLADGSTVLLNTDTRITVRYGSDARSIVLEHGEAYFTAKQDAKRPFTVEAGKGRLSTLGAGFRVRLLDDAPADVLVSEGQVRALADPDSGHPIVLGRQTRFILSASAAGAAAPIALGPDEITRDLAWREGKIAFQGENLEQAADAFARYADPRIEVRDAGLRQEPVTGLFAADDPVGFSRAVASIFGAKVSLQDQRVIISAGTDKKI